MKGNILFEILVRRDEIIVYRQMIISLEKPRDQMEYYNS